MSQEDLISNMKKREILLAVNKDYNKFEFQGSPFSSDIFIVRDVIKDYNKYEFQGQFGTFLVYVSLPYFLLGGALAYVAKLGESIIGNIVKSSRSLHMSLQVKGPSAGQTLKAYFIDHPILFAVAVFSLLLGIFIAYRAAKKQKIIVDHTDLEALKNLYQKQCKGDN